MRYKDRNREGCTTQKVIDDYKSDGLNVEDALLGMRTFGFDYNSRKSAAIAYGSLGVVGIFYAVINGIKAKKASDGYEAYYNRLVYEKRREMRNAPKDAREDNND